MKVASRAAGVLVLIGGMVLGALALFGGLTQWVALANPFVWPPTIGICAFPMALAGLILSLVSLYEASKEKEKNKKAGAIVGLILDLVALVVSFPFLFMLIWG